jgi:glycerophosphoryl diester phosphodiesterase
MEEKYEPKIRTFREIVEWAKSVPDLLKRNQGIECNIEIDYEKEHITISPKQ